MRQRTRSWVGLGLLVGLGLACTPATAPPPASQPAPTTDPVPPPGSSAAPACASIPATVERYSIAVDGAHRGCTHDDECHTVKLDCSNVDCTAVHRDHASTYATPLSCHGYSGPMANYDCMPHFEIEAPRCVGGCCTSVRIEPQG